MAGPDERGSGGSGAGLIFFFFIFRVCFCKKLVVQLGIALSPTSEK